MEAERETDSPWSFLVWSPMPPETCDHDPGHHFLGGCTVMIDGRRCPCDGSGRKRR
jgi:hypothetical protein